MAMLAAVGMAISLAAAPQKDASAAAQMQAAINKQTVEGDLNGAIKQYAAIVAKYAKTDRAATAAALVRMAECYQAMGDAEARKIYEQVVREYGDQKDAVAMARARLGATNARELRPAARQVWAGSYDERPAAISADGRFAVSREVKTAAIIVRDLQTGTKRTLDARGRYYWPGEETIRMSPDGQWVAYVVTDTRELRLIRTDGAESRTLYTWPIGARIRVYPLAWTPDQKYVLFSTTEAPRKPAEPVSECEWMLVPAAGGPARTLRTGVSMSDGSHTSFSSDGRFIAYTGGDGHAHVMTVDGGTDIRLTDSSESEVVVGWVPKSDYLVFRSDLSPGWGLYAIRVPNGKALGAPRLIKGDTRGQIQVGVTSSGAFYYVQVPTTINAYVVSLNPDAGTLNGEPSRVTQRFDDMNAMPMWSPDGRKLAWFGMRALQQGLNLANASIVVRDLASGAETTAPVLFPRGLGYSPQYMPSPTWLSDGRSIVIGATGDSRSIDLLKVDPASGETARFEDEAQPNKVTGQFSWTVDGSTMYRGIGNTIEARKTPNGAWTKIFSEAEGDGIRDAAPSPDGTKILYVLIPKGGDSMKGPIKILDLAGGRGRIVASECPAWLRRSMAWTPDGRFIVYVTESNPTRFWIVPAQGGTPKQLGHDMEGRIFDLTFSPDGKQLGYTQTIFRAELWAMENFLLSAK
jgi:Tol biopolymer transport system component